MTVEALYKLLDREIPSSLSCEWDNDGLMCSSCLSREVGRVLCTLDVTEDAVEYAIENGFDLIISHHPLIFTPLSSVAPNEAVARKVMRLLEAQISVFSFHTRADAHDDGVNARLSKMLGLRNVRKFGPDGEEMGRIGEIAPMELSEFCALVKSVTGSPVVLASGNLIVNKVAVLGGNGKDFVTSAIEEGADTYLSGRISYEKTLSAKEIGMNLVEAGHFYTEHHITGFFADLLGLLTPEAYTEIYCSNTIEVF